MAIFNCYVSSPEGTQLVPGMFRHSSSSLAVAPLVDTHLWPCMHIHFGNGSKWLAPQNGWFGHVWSIKNKRNMMFNMMKHDSFSLYGPSMSQSPFLETHWVIVIDQRNSRKVMIRFVSAHSPNHSPNILVIIRDSLGKTVCLTHTTLGAGSARWRPLARSGTAVFFSAPVARGWCAQFRGSYLRYNCGISSKSLNWDMIITNYILLLHYTTLHFSTTKA